MHVRVQQHGESMEGPFKLASTAQRSFLVASYLEMSSAVNEESFETGV